MGNSKGNAVGFVCVSSFCDNLQTFSCYTWTGSCAEHFLDLPCTALFLLFSNFSWRLLKEFSLLIFASQFQ